MRRNLHILGYILLLFAGWRLALFFIAFLGLSALPNENFYTKELFFPKVELDYWGRWTNWDGKAYQDIANLGYEPVLTVFFPAYSILIKALKIIGLSSFHAGLLISNASMVLAMFFLFKLIKLDFGVNVAKRGVFALIIFPSSFYLVALYNESLTLFITVTAFYFARKKRWILASLFASLAATTRLTGIAAILGILFEYLINYETLLKEKIKLSLLWYSRIGRFFWYFLFLVVLLNVSYFALPQESFLLKGLLFSVFNIIKLIFYFSAIVFAVGCLRYLLKFIDFKRVYSRNFLFLIGSGIPLSLYLIYQKINFGSFFSFLSYESVWGKYFSPPWNGPLTSLNFLLYNLFAIGEYSARIHLRLVIFAVALVGLIVCFRKLRLSYAIFYLMAFLIPLFSGSLIDFPRYSLIFFPLFIVLGLIENEVIQKIWMVLSISLLTLLLILFFNSYFFM